MIRRGPFALALCLTLGIPAVASADEANVTAAEGLFLEGRDLMERGRFEEACDRFARSDQLDTAVGTLLNLGECYERLGKTASAWAAYRRAITLADTRSDTRRGERARRAAADIEPRLSRLSIMTPRDAPPGLSVTRGSARVESAALNTAVPVDPGAYEIEVSAPDRKPWRTRVEVADGKTVRVAIPELEPLEQDTPGPAPKKDSARLQRTAAIGLEIGGGALLAAGLVFGGLALSRWSSVEDACPDAKCPSQSALDEQSEGARAAQTLSTVSTVTAIVGVAAIAAGVVLHLTTPRRQVTLAPAALGGVLKVEL